MINFKKDFVQFYSFKNENNKYQRQNSPQIYCPVSDFSEAWSKARLFSGSHQGSFRSLHWVLFFLFFSLSLALFK